MKLFLKISLLLLLPAFTKAQIKPYWREPTKQQADSLILVLQHTTNDTMRMFISRQLGVYFAETKADSCLYFYEQQLLLAQQLKLKIWEAEGYKGVGWAFFKLGKFPQSLEAFLNGSKIAADPATEKNIWHLSFFSNEENPHVARLTVLSIIYEFMAVLYNNASDEKKTVSTFAESRKIAESINEEAILSLVYLNFNGHFNSFYRDAAHLTPAQIDSGLALQQKSLYYSNQSGYKKYRGFNLMLIARLYKRQGNYDSAKAYLAQSIQTNEEQNSLTFLAWDYLELADIYKLTGVTGTSLFYCKKAYETLKAISASPGEFTRVYNALSSIYKLQNNTDSAYFYLQLAMAAKDSSDEVEATKQFQNIGFDEQLKVRQLEEEKIKVQNKITTWSLLAGIAVFMLVAFLLFRNNRNRKKANTLLQKQKEEIGVQKKNVEQTLSELKSTQSQLIQSEKMASLGELTAGIAHEIQNPLNFVNNFSDVNKELLAELNEEIDKENYDEVKAIAKDVIDNEEKINHHGKRAEAIVKGMLQHSQTSTGKKEATNINALADEYLRLAYHGLRAKDKGFNATMKTNFDENIGNINIIPQDIGRVLLNLYNNAFYALNEKMKLKIENYEPTISVSTKKVSDKILISVKDNGSGIPQKIVDKIFQPFFTTKPTGKGTGLGLSLSYDIIKAHGGEIKVETKEGEGTAFIIQLPLS